MHSVRFCGGSLLLVLLAAQSASGIWFRTESIEWQTDVADGVALATVTDTRPIEPLNEAIDSQQVTCRTTEALKGSGTKTITFRQDYARNERGESPGRLGAGARVLRFLHAERRDGAPAAAAAQV